MIFSHAFTVSKRLLGILLLLCSLAAIAGVLAIDVLDPTREGGIGPAQQMALLAAGLGALVGLSLIPLGARPA
jgi:hypothetical protein